MGVKAIAEKLQDNLQALHYHESIPAVPPDTEPTEGPPIPYFDHVWIGMPEKIPMGDKRVAVIEAATDPDFFYTTCAANTKNDTEFYITLYCKGTTEKANLAVYEIRDIVVPVLYTDDTVSGTCLGATVENVIYGDMAGTSGVNMIAACRITLKCRLL